MICYLKTHHMFHTEAVHRVLVVIVGGVPVPRIEVVVHQTIADHQVVRVQGVGLRPETEQGLLQTLVIVLVVLVRKLAALVLLSSMNNKDQARADHMTTYMRGHSFMWS